MVRATFSHDLRQLQDQILQLGSMVDRAIEQSVVALREQNTSLARQVDKGDEAINAARWEIEQTTINLIATQAPMARDLRQIMASVHVATNLERMGDHARGIAKLTLRTADEPLLKPLIDIPRMATLGREMLHDSLEAFVEQNAQLAMKIALRDEQVDDHYEQIYRELLTFMIADPSTVPKATHLLWVAHNLERIADRVTNICERTIFSVTGQFEEVNDKDFGAALEDLAQ
ncbi:MAG: phosphate signaling complex protein PhoU [Chloroflexota bacterium]